MTQLDTVDKLKQYAANNPAVQQLFAVWSLRLRARTTVTVGAVAQMMKNSGYSYPRSKYADILGVLGRSFNVGTIIKTSRGNIAAITNMRYTLKSIGDCGLGKSSTLVPRKQSRMTAHVVVPTAERAPVKGKVMIRKPNSQKNKSINAVWNGDKGIRLAFALKGKIFTIIMPTNCTGTEIAEIIDKFQESRNGEEESEQS